MYDLIKQGIALGKSLHKNHKGISGVGAVTAIIGVVIGIYVFALMFPDALETLFNVSWDESVPAGVVTLSTTVVALLGAIVFVLLLVKQAD